MPEYSTPKLTPAETTKLPGMNSNNSGYVTVEEVLDIIRNTYGQANGPATLDGSGKLNPSQIPDNLDDVLVYATRSNFPVTGADGKIYITADNNKLYRWDSNASDYVELSVDLSAYATKAELNALSARVSNLEQTTKQDEQTVAYPDDGNYSSIMPNGVPASVAKYGEVPTIRGKARGWNQLCPIDVLASKTVSDVTITNNGDGSWTLNGTASSDIAEYLTGALNLPIGHKFLFGYVNINTEITGLLMRDQYSFAGTGTTTISNWSVSTSAFAVIIANGTALNNVKIIPIIRDLTRIFGSGNEPSTVADAIAQLPALGQYNAYDAGSLVDTVVSGAKAIGRNRLDKSVYEDNTWVSANGEKYVQTGKRTFTVDKIKPSTNYALKGFENAEYYTLTQYDANGTFLAGVEGSGTPAYSLITNPLTQIIMVSLYNNTGMDIMLVEGSTIPTEFEPYFTDTLPLSAPVTLKSAGSVAEVLTLETGKKTRPIGSVDLGTLTWQEGVNSGGHRCFYTGGLLSSIKPSASDGDMANITCARYVTLTRNLEYNNEIGIAANVSGYVYIYDPAYESYTYEQFKSAMSGVYLYYELATPLSDEQVCDPIPDNYVEVEGGGTINTIQSQTPVIDNCLDVTYDFIPV